MDEPSSPDFLNNYFNMPHLRKIQALLLIIVLLIALCAILLVVLVQQKRGNKGGTVEREHGTTTTLYTHRSANFSIRVSNNLSMAAKPNASWLAFYDERALQQTYNGGLMQGMKLEIIVTQNQVEQTVQEYVDNAIRGNESYISNKKEIAVAGRPAVQLVSDVLGYSLVTYVKDKDDTVFTITAYMPEKENREFYSALYSEAVNSFQLF